VATLPASQSEKVGLVGTKKWVRVRSPPDPSKNFVAGLWEQYVAGFWNTIGGTYLTRHNFGLRTTNAADGGVFCVAARAALMRASIVKDAAFTQAFTNEYLLRFGDWVSGFGPVVVDDDVFLTRWVIDNGWDIKIQLSEETVMTTAIGEYPLKFPSQCERWSRTTMRQNPIKPLIDRTVWWKFPLTVWSTELIWLYNAALFWDGLAAYALTRTDMYAQSADRKFMLCALIGLFWTTKLIKTLPWYWMYPTDFILYFLIPAAPIFTCCHSLLKVYTALTFWNIEWLGRQIE